MEFIWECMILLLKVTLGGLGWSVIIGAIFVIIGVISSIKN